ncbi:MAG: flavodoxin family protein [Myxococcaceae bacterium]
MAPSRVLVVFFSRTGTTKQVAAELAQALGADVAELSEARSRSGLLGYLRSGFEAFRHRTTTLRDFHEETLRYGLAVVGTPVWVGSVCSPVRTFLRHHAGKLPPVAFFATMGGRGSETAFLQMTDEAKRSPIASLAVAEADVRSGKHTERLRVFARELGRTNAVSASSNA